MSDPTSRRDFLHTSTAAALGGWMSLGLAGCGEAARSAADAIAAGDAPLALTDQEMRTLDALADRIIPADGDAPGASAARAVVFMDHYAADKPDMLEGLRAVAGMLGPDFAALDAAARDEGARGFEERAPDLFGLVHFLTVVGTFSLPSRGGNRDGAGWRMLGFEDRHAWQPPFGAYDAAARLAEGGGA